MPSPRHSSRLRGALALAAALLAPASAFAGSLLALDFETALSSAVSTTDGLGTVDAFMGSPGRALSATGRVSTGRIPVSNTEADLAKLTVGFDIHVATLAPVRVTLASFDASGQRTGARTTVVAPPVAGAYYRFSVDLDKTEQLDGTFDPLAPSIEFTFAADTTLRIDNLSYTAPSFYVSPTGSDSADGRTAATAFATPQHAANVSRPGDVILLMDGTYVSPGHPDISDVPADTINSPLWRPWWVEKTGGNVTIKNSGTPAAWIVLRAHPGHRPVLFNAEGWHGVRFGLTAAYVEVRGLKIQG
ncbi:MAG: hypothetical protein H7Y06_08150, partial [Opitutaceae bacterium]|nr:hypothetical protein [Opitutaceae bacterium]